jgi:ribonuclease J
MEKLEKDKRIKIIPLGGLEQIGMNMTVLEYENEIIIIDCGMAFPGDDMPGIDKIIPDVTYLKENKEKLKAMVITHGHEDHIGAIPYLIRDLDIPIYGTKLTIELIRDRLNREGIGKVKTKTVNFGEIITFLNFNIEFIKTNHSIQDAAALSIKTPAGNIIHTGDFKIDYTPVFGDRINLSRFAELGNEGVLAVLSDSTNAMKPGFTMSERTVGETFDTIFAKHRDNRIIVGTFSSNVDRVQQLFDTSYKYKRKVAIDGKSMKTTISIAAKLGYVKIPEGTWVNINDIYKYPDSEIVVVATGSQGESMASISRMSTGCHKNLSIKPNDVIVLSSTPIPGNEKAVANVISRLAERHAEVIHQDTHVSGHACQEELKLIYSLLKPRYVIPLHGDYRQRYAAKQVAEKIGVKSEDAIILKDGDVLEIGKEKAKIKGSVPHGKIMIDMLGAKDIDGKALKDRQKLSSGGIVIISLTINTKTGTWFPNPAVTSFGLSRSEISAKLFLDLREELNRQMRKHPVCKEAEYKAIRNKINRNMELFIHAKTGLDTIVFTTVNEA